MKMFCAFFVFLFLSCAAVFAGTPTYFCPACSAPMQCKRTTPNEATGAHPLEQARQSLWRCLSCGARFLLNTPVGKLSKIAKKEQYV